MGIWFCEMEIECPKNWDDLSETQNSKVRDCSSCGKSVVYVETKDELEKAAEDGTCVAFYKLNADEIDFGDRLKIDWIRLKKGATQPVRVERMTLGLPSKRKRSKDFWDVLSDEGEKKPPVQ